MKTIIIQVFCTLCFTIVPTKKKNLQFRSISLTRTIAVILESKISVKKSYTKNKYSSQHNSCFLHFYCKKIRNFTINKI